MFVARVVGNIWATQKSTSLNNKKMLLVQKLKGADFQPSGEIMMAVCDAIDAGPGDTVLVMDEGSSARMILNDPRAPIRTIVVGIVDHISVMNRSIFFPQ